jgi:hypothetical protein
VVRDRAEGAASHLPASGDHGAVRKAGVARKVEDREDQVDGREDRDGLEDLE